MKASYLYLNILVFCLCTAAMCEKKPQAAIESQTISSSLSQKSDPWHRYEFETAIVKMVKKTINPQMELTIEETIYIREFGAQEARIIKETQEVKMLGNMKNVSRSHTIMNREELISIKDGKAFKMKNPAKPLLKAYENSSQGQRDAFEKDIHDALNANTTTKGTDQVAGKTCQVRETISDLNGIKTVIEQCMYKGFVMRTLSDAMGIKTTEEVISFEENTTVPKDVFEVGSGIQVREMPKIPGVN